MQAGTDFIGSQDAVESAPGIVDLFSGASLPRGAVKLPKAGNRTGRLGTHFFTQNSGIIFFNGSRRSGTNRNGRGEKLSQINGGAFQKTSRN